MSTIVAHRRRAMLLDFPAASGGGGHDLTQEVELRARDLAQLGEELAREVAEGARLGLHLAQGHVGCLA